MFKSKTKILTKQSILSFFSEKYIFILLQILHITYGSENKFLIAQRYEVHDYFKIVHILHDH